MKYITPLTILLASSAMFAQEITYDKVISADASQSALQGNTLIQSGATLELNGDNRTNYNLKIEEGAVLDFTANDAFKWGTGSGPVENSIENYGTIYVLAGKEFRFGDSDSMGAKTTLNLYNGSILTTKEGTGTFNIANYRGEDTVINIYTGAKIENVGTLTTWDRGNNNADTQKFSVNVAGGKFSVANMNLGNQPSNRGITTHSEINVSDGGLMTTTGNINMGQNATNDVRINVSGENSVWNSTGTIYVGRNANSSAGITASNGGVINSAYTQLQYGGLTVNDGGTFNSISGFFVINGGLTVNNGGVFNSNAGVEVQNNNVLVNEGGSYNVVKGSTLAIGNKADQTASFTVDGGSFNLTATNSDFSIYVANSSTATANLKITNGGVYQQANGAKNTQLWMNSGNGTLEISDGGKWFANTNFYVGGASGANSTLILNNGKIANSAGTGASSDVNLAYAANSTGRLEVSNGGSAILRSFRMAQGGANAKATLIIKDAGSFVKATNTNDTNYLFSLGMNVADGDKYTGNSAIVEIHTGAQLANTAGGFSSIKDSAQMTFVLDSSNINYASTAMFSTKNLAVYKTADTVSNPFVIDGANLGAVNGLSEGDIAEFVIMTISGDATLNNAILDFSNIELIAGIFEFKNNTDLADWEDFGLENLSFAGGNLVLSLTYVPEPSTYAAIFGALALAFAAYRRRK